MKGFQRVMLAAALCVALSGCLGKALGDMEMGDLVPPDRQWRAFKEWCERPNPTPEDLALRRTKCPPTK